MIPGFRFPAFFLWTVACFLPVAVAAGEAGALRDTWTLEADSLSTFGQAAEVIAEGDVLLKRPAAPGVKPIELQADWLYYNSDRNEIEARGHLTLEAQGDRITAAAARLDLNEQTGTLHDTTMLFAENNLYFSGSVLDKRGDASYRFVDGRVTACRTTVGQPSPWSFWSRDATVTVDEFAVLKHATFRIKDVPVLYTPYLVFPVRSARESGFLIPEFSRSHRDGVGLMAPYFIDISPSVDATVYAGYLDRRGVNPAVEFRYVAAVEKRGTMLVNYLHDQTTDNGLDDFKQDGYYRDHHDRYWLRGKADHGFADRLVGRLDLDLVSDRDYLREFADGVTGFTRGDRNFVNTFGRGLQEESIPFRESTLQLSRAASSVYWAGELRGVDDATRDTATDRQLQTVPRLLVDGQAWLGDRVPLHVDWQSEYVQYWRDAGLGYQRLDLHPRLRLAVPAGRLVEGRVRAGVRETLYRVEPHGAEAEAAWGQGRSLNRTAYDLEANTAFMLTRDFELTAGSLRRLNHSLRPNLRYNYVTTRREEAFPVLDSEDPVGQTNGLTYELNQYFLVGGQRGQALYERYLGYFKLWQTFNIAEERRELTSQTDRRRPFSEISLDLLSYPVDSLSVRYLTGLDVYGQGIKRYSLESRYYDPSGNAFSLDYIYAQGVSRDLKMGLRFRLLEAIAVKAETTRSLLLDRTVSESAGLIYSPHCWSVEVDLTRTSDDQRLMFTFSLAGLGKALEFGKDNL